MTATYVFGPLDHRRADDVRASCLRHRRAADAHRRRRMAVAADRQPRHAADFRLRRPEPARLRPACSAPAPSTSSRTTTQHWEMRPSLWIEPIGDWGEGEVHADRNPLRLPSSTTMSSPSGGPRPASPPARRSPSPIASSGAGRRPPSRRSRPCVSSRRGKVGKRQRFVVEFAADLFADPQKAAQVTAEIAAAPGQIVCDPALSLQGPARDPRSCSTSSPARSLIRSCAWC